MFNSRPAAIVALFLILGYALPVLCMPTSAAEAVAQTASPMSCGGCPSHHPHAPAPSHSCCASHSTPAALQAATSVAPLSHVAGQQNVESTNSPNAAIAVAVDHADFSPPRSAVLRI